MNETCGTAEKKKGGCGKAIGVGCLAVVLLVGVGGFLAYKNASKLFAFATAQYTADAPLQFAPVQATEQEVADLKARVERFAEAVKAGQGGKELTLDARDINLLIQQHPGWSEMRGKVSVALSGDRLTGDASIPLDELAKASPLLKSLSGKWLNGSGTFRVEMAAGRLLVFMDSLSVRGKPLPENFMAGIRAKNLAEDAAAKPDAAALLAKLESVAVRDGKLTIRSK